ncbi:hypothetical protein [Spongiimicrobium sp. 3-5]|uniref:hypothetical protein n=1 Tax=Spongiimicrobium sp. 3-5 TaxID=3332596 RepID=UPI0039803541
MNHTTPLLVSLLFTLTFNAGNSQSLALNKADFESNEPITVSIKDMTQAKNFWVALARPDQSPSDYLDAQWMDNEGHTKMYAPSNAGSYEVRLFMNWPNGAYKVKAINPLRVKSYASENEVRFPYFSLSQDWKLITMLSKNEDKDPNTQMLTEMSDEWIIEQFEKEKSSIGLARLEAVYKRKLLNLLNSKGYYTNLRLPDITNTEIDAITAKYDSLSDSKGKRWLSLREAWKGINYIFDINHPKFARDRVVRMFNSEKLTKIFKPVCALGEIHQFYFSISDGELLKDFWRIKLNGRLDKLNCQNHDMYIFRDGLGTQDLSEIERIKQKENEHFSSLGLSTTPFPPFKNELKINCY